LLYASGLRRGELAKLQVSDLNLERGTLVVRGGKGNKDRVGYFGKKATDAIRTHLSGRERGLLFHVHRDTVARIVSQAAKRAGVMGVHTHTFRHAFATHLLDRGADLISYAFTASFTHEEMPMSNSKEIQPIRVEVMPPENSNDSRVTPTDAKGLLKKLVQRQVAEIMAQRDEFLFQPFFHAKKVSDQVRRLQTMPEQQKWSRYFERYGCLICGTREVTHGSLGMCVNCHGRTVFRLKTVISDPDGTKTRPYGRFGQQEDVEVIARRALLLPAPCVANRKKARREQVNPPPRNAKISVHRKPSLASRC
jgi:hypothetical protein